MRNLSSVPHCVFMAHAMGRPAVYDRESATWAVGDDPGFDPDELDPDDPALRVDGNTPPASIPEDDHDNQEPTGP